MSGWHYAQAFSSCSFYRAYQRDKLQNIHENVDLALQFHTLHLELGMSSPSSSTIATLVIRRISFDLLGLVSYYNKLVNYL